MMRYPTICRGLLVALLLGVGGLSGCGEQQPAVGPDGRKIVRFSILMISTQQVEFYNWVEKIFEERNPDIDLVIEQFPGSSIKDFEVKLRLRFASGTPPDVFLIHENISMEFAMLGLLDEAPDRICELARFNGVNEMARKAPFIGDTCYGIASDAIWTALYYNKAMFREAGLDPEKPPETWDELLDYAERLTVRDADGEPTRAGISLRKTGYKPGTAEKWTTFLLSAGGSLFDDGITKATFNTQAGRDALDFYDEVLFKRKIDSVNLDGDQQGFGQGKAAMFIREAHVIRWLQNNYPDIEFGVAPIPGKTSSLSSGGAYLLAVPVDSPNKPEAWHVVDFLMSDEIYTAYTAIGGVMPATKSVASLPQFADDPYISVFLEQDVPPTPNFLGAIKAQNIIGAYIERFCYGHIEAEDLLTRAAQDVTATLGRTNQLRKRQEN